MLLCHVPPGNPENAHTLCISPNAVAAHLQNHEGDYCGPCDSAAREDFDGSGAVDFGDILAILGAWGNKAGPEDLDGSGTVDFGDLLEVLTAWGLTP